MATGKGSNHSTRRRDGKAPTRKFLDYFRSQGVSNAGESYECVPTALITAASSGCSIGSRLAFQQQSTSPPQCSPEQESSNSNSIPDLGAHVPNKQLSSTQPALCSDGKRTLQRYEDATNSLIDALKLGRPGWKAFELLLNLDAVPQGTNDLHVLQESIESKLSSNSELNGTRHLWSKGKRGIERLFVSMSPFAKNFLLVAKDLQSIPLCNPFGVLIGGLLLLVQIADREIGRAAQIEKELDYIVRQFEQLKVVDQLPDSCNLPGDLVNRAMDVRSASMKYVAVHIRHESQSLGFGTAGRVLSTAFLGDLSCDSAGTELQQTVTEFNSTLSRFGHTVTFQTFEEIKGLRKDFETMHRSPGHCPQRSAHFIVPYQRNEHFTGRKELLDTFFGKLSEIIPRSHNHRLALYGLGGVGKTQLALQYAYTYKANYDAIYWISAVNQASLLSGLREVGKRTGCLLNVDSAEKGVVSWLNQQDRWLLILDNLDDATVVDGFLPDTSPNQHTLITTRNPNTDEIPAEGLEISVLQLQDAIDLLYLRSKVPRISQIPNGEAEATKIVQELGLLPLAVEQAAAYIREVSKDIFKFLPSYQKNRQRYHRRIPRGNWKYQNSIATTWRLSFERVEQNNIAAAQLLRLLSFLNPDGILTEFLETGKEGLSTDLLDTIADSDKFDEALSELERWSIIRREPDEAGGQRITIHRLVQAVIKDEMTEADFLLFTGEVLSLCDRSFPQYGLKKELRPLCRKYQTQVIIPLSEIPVTKSTTQLRLLKRISWFLHDDGKYSQSREMKLKVVELCTLLVGKDHPDTLSAKGKLAVTYSREGRLTEAIQLQSEILDEMSAQLGAEHPKVLTIISNLALTHLQQGHLQEALILQKRALEERKRILGDEHPDTLTAMSRLGATHRTQERWNEAVELHEKVLAARARLLGEEHPDTLMAMSSLAYSYIGPYRWVEAQKLLEKVIVARMCLLGGDHMDTLTTMSRLALTYAGQRRWDDALKLQTEALEGWTKICGEDHPETLTALSWLASTYWEMNDGQRDHAVRLYKKVLAARVRVLGKDHPTTLSTEKMVDDIAEIGEGS